MITRLGVVIGEWVVVESFLGNRYLNFEDGGVVVIVLSDLENLVGSFSGYRTSPERSWELPEITNQCQR